MPAPCFQRCVVAFQVYRLLLLQYCRYGLECHPEVYVLSVADASLYASAAVGEGGDGAVGRGDEGIVLFAASLGCSGKSLSVFKAFDGVDAHHGSG